MIVYFDTSALIKLILEEEGTEIADELWLSAQQRVASILVYPEAGAALAAAQRAKRIELPVLRKVQKDLTSLCQAITLIEVDEVLSKQAGNLAEQYRLRGYDAVHLATAITVNDGDLVLATWDRDLNAAAIFAGCDTAPRV